MDTLRAAFHKLTGTDETGWTPWTAPPKPGDTAGSATPTSHTPVDAAALSTPAPIAAPAVTPPWRELQRLGLLAATTATPGPIGAVLTTEAKAGLADFLRRMDAGGVRIALCHPAERGAETRYKPLTPDEAMTWLASQPATFDAPVATWTASDPPVPLASLTDLKTLDALRGADGAAEAPNPGLACAIRSLTERGWQLSSSQPSWHTLRSRSTLQAYHCVSAGRSVDVWTKDGQLTMRAECADDLLATDYFDGAGVDRGLSRPQEAATLRALESAGWRFRATPDGLSQPHTSARDAYLEIADGRTVVMMAAGGDAAFMADAPLLADPDRVKERADEVERLYREHVRPRQTRTHDADDVARFFEILYASAPSRPREETAERLAAISDVSPYDTPKVFEQVMATAARGGDVDGLIADYTRIARAGLADADRLSAFRYLSETVPTLAGSDAQGRAALRETFMSVLEHIHTPGMAKRAVEICSQPIGSSTLTERADVMRTVASTYRSEWENELVADYVRIMVPTGSTPAERARHMAETLAPLQEAFGRHSSMKAVRDAHEAWALTLLLVGNETQSERTALMQTLIESRDGQEALDVYPALLLDRLPDEGIVETGECFRQVAALLAQAAQRERAIEAFHTLQDARRGLPAETRGEVMTRFNETIVLKNDVDAALAAVSRSQTPAGQIVDDGRTVTIGGIRVERNSGG